MQDSPLMEYLSGEPKSQHILLYGQIFNCIFNLSTYITFAQYMYIYYNKFEQF